MTTAAEPDFSDLPQYCKDYTAEQHERVVAWLSALPMADLRQRQAIVEEQKATAYERSQKPAPPPWLEASMDDLDGRANQLFDAIMRKLTKRLQA